MHIHPALQLKTLSKDIRQHAVAAANGDEEAFGILYDLGNPHRLSGGAVKFLPVYYAGLASDTIPRLLAQLRSNAGQDDTTDLTTAIIYLIFCLDGVHVALMERESYPNAASADLWAVVSPCIHFLDTYRDILPAINVMSTPPKIYRLFLGVIFLLREHAPTAISMAKTPGLRGLFVRMWAVFLGEPEITDDFEETSQGRVGNFAMFCAFTTAAPNLFSVTSEEHFQEAIEGAGGTKGSFAALIVKHHECVKNVGCTSDPRWSAAINSLAPHSGIFNLLEKTAADREFQEALIQNGIIGPLTTITCRLTAPPYSVQQPDFFRMSFSNLIPYIVTSHHYGPLNHLLRGGLLKILSAVADEHAFAQCDSWPDLLTRVKIVLLVVQHSLVYFSTLSQLEIQLGGVTEDFLGNSPLSDAWKEFWSVLQERREVAQKFVMRTTSSQSACDNVSCEIIRPQSEFKRCSGCLTLNYCSAKCQLFDWREGGHRSSCKSLLELRRNDTTELKSKDRAFLRAIVQNDYAKFKGQIITDQVNYLRATPGVRACELTVHFNYLSQSTDPPSGISIGTLADLAATVPVWKDYVSRARRSDGRMRIHVMHVLDGAHGTCWLFPLRSATGDLAREIERLAAEEKGSKLDQEAVRCLVQRNVEEIHLASRN